MVELIATKAALATPPDISHIVTEDDTPVDNIFSAKQQRLLVHTLYASWQTGRKYIADSNVGVFSSPSRPPIVPDMFLSLDVEITDNWFAQEHRSYFIWYFGKPPDLVVEIISNKKGGENNKKLQEYASMGIGYYAVYDPQLLIQDDLLKLYALQDGEYVLAEGHYLEKIGLGLKLWHGLYEDGEGEWLRWCDEEGNLLLSGAEIAAAAGERAQAERERADAERARADRLAQKLRAMGIDPED